ncbi:MAG: lactonase family protein [Treponema sp.]|jgi:6-phosphogluconolactonase|nr:lactonase family protein [Treponema sp.]
MTGYLGVYMETQGRRANGTDGIYSFSFDPETGRVDRLRVAVQSVNPTYLALSSTGEFLYAINEIVEWQGQRTGAVSAFAVGGGGNLSFLNQVSSNGRGPCHIALAPHPAAVVSNYTDGSISILPVNKDGSLSAPTQTICFQGKSVDAERQDAPHAHCFAFDNTGKRGFACDLGSDRVRGFRFLTDSHRRLRLKEHEVFISNPGSGPRHMVFHPSKPVAYVVNELNSTVDVLDMRLKETMSSVQKLQTITTLTEPLPGNTASAVKLDADARLLYVSNRGRDSITVFGVQENGLLEYVGAFPSGGRTPRDFTLAGDFLLVCHQDSDNLVVFRIDRATAEKTGEYEALSGVCVVVRS